ncbi:mechanosensitive ion channel domain-containing protein, partial [Planctomycetota bacterium]
TEEIVQQSQEANDTVAQAQQQLQERVETISQSISESNDIAPAIQESNSVEELSSIERDVVEKTEEVNEARQALQDTIDEIARSDISLEEKVQKIGEAENALNTKLKEQMLVTINKLREEKTTLTDRFNTVLAALEAKGGEVEEYEKYVAAISGMDVSMESIQDVSAFKIMVIGWLKSSEGGLRWLKNIVLFIITILIFYILAVITGRITHRAVSKSKKFSDLLKQFFSGIVFKTVLIIGIIIALPKLGINIAPMLAGLGVIGFILGFALQGTLSNFASGLMILMYRPYDVGQIIEAAGVKGVVNSMNLVSTTIKTFDNQIIVIPNGSIWGDVITNVTGSNTRRVDMKFGISYSDDIAKVAEILEDIVRSHELVLKDPEPVVKLHELGDSSVNFVCRPWVKTPDYWTVYWDVTRTVKERFDKQGVSIPFPQRDVHIIKQDD